jgi:hypothetical protein
VGKLAEPKWHHMGTSEQHWCATWPKEKTKLRRFPISLQTLVEAKLTWASKTRPLAFSTLVNYERKIFVKSSPAWWLTSKGGFWHFGKMTISAMSLTQSLSIITLVFHSRSGCVHAMHLLSCAVTRPNLELKTWHKKLLGSLPLDIALPAWT